MLSNGSNTITVGAKDRANNHAVPASITVLKIDSSIVYVDARNSAYEDGSYNNPFNTLAEGVSGCQQNGTIIIRPGIYTGSTAFKAGQKIQADGNGVTLDCGATPYVVNGSLFMEGLRLTGTE